MDADLHPDGCSRLAGLEEGRLENMGHDALCRTACPEPVLAHLAEPCPWAGAGLFHASDPDRPPAPEQVGSSGVSALSDLDYASYRVGHRALAFALNRGFRL